MARRARADVPVLLLYAAISFAFFGWRLLPHPGRVVVATSADFQIFVWSFASWPHALAQLTSPFVTHALYVPGGINLTMDGVEPGARARVLADHRPVRADGRVQRRRGPAAGARRLDRVPALPPPDGVGLRFGDRRVPVRVLDRDARPGARRPPALSWCILGNDFTLPQGLVPFGPQGGARSSSRAAA
jgi:hypothetical protein